MKWQGLGRGGRRGRGSAKLEIVPQQELAMKGQSGGWMDGQMDELRLRSAKRHLGSSPTMVSYRQGLDLGSPQRWCAQRVSGWVWGLAEHGVGHRGRCWGALLEQRLLWGAGVHSPQTWACPNPLALAPQVSCLPTGPRHPQHLVEGASRASRAQCLPQTCCSNPPQTATLLPAPCHRGHAPPPPLKAAEGPQGLGCSAAGTS